MTKQKAIARFIFKWLFTRPFVLFAAAGYWIGSDDLTYKQCLKKMWSDLI